MCVAQLKEEVLALGEQRAAIMAKIDEATAFLATQPVGLEGNLTDKDGFPRNDCDLYAIRTARNTVRCAETDLRAVEEALYGKLAELHECTRGEAEEQMVRDEDARRKGKAAAVAQQKRLLEQRRIAKLAPILRAASVEVDSPAYEAGIRPGQLLVQFGDLNVETLSAKGGPQAIAQLTAAHKGLFLSVWTREPGDTETVERILAPQQWRGNGLLGCALEPV